MKIIIELLDDPALPMWSAKVQDVDEKIHDVPFMYKDPHHALDTAIAHAYLNKWK